MATCQEVFVKKAIQIALMQHKIVVSSVSRYGVKYCISKKYTFDLFPSCQLVGWAAVGQFYFSEGCNCLGAANISLYAFLKQCLNYPCPMQNVLDIYV